MSDKKIWNVLSLGAGVQSSCIALMIEKGDLPPIDFAIFADTGAEPQEVYDWLDFLKEEVSYPIHTVVRGSLTDDSLKLYKNQKTGVMYPRVMIPTFGLMADGTVVGAMGRKCTADYKIAPLIKLIREKCGIKHGQKDVTVNQIMGISWDELQRMKNSPLKFLDHSHPLIDKRMTRRDCKIWMMDNNYPEPPESSCVYCPFHRDELWRDLRDNQPEEFAKAVKFDKDFRDVNIEHNKTLKMIPYLHRSCKPLDEIDFDNDEDKGQLTWDFESECEGMCGI